MPTKGGRGVNARDFQDEAANAGHVSSFLYTFCINSSFQDEEEDPFAATRRPKIVDKQNEYQRRQSKRKISPERADMFGKRF
jgi:hypothetical protein